MTQFFSKSERSDCSGKCLRLLNPTAPIPPSPLLQVVIPAKTKCADTYALLYIVCVRARGALSASISFAGLKSANSFCRRHLYTESAKRTSRALTGLKLFGAQRVVVLFCVKQKTQCGDECDTLSDSSERRCNSFAAGAFSKAVFV
jgi:hypothetical protein